MLRLVISLATVLVVSPPRTMAPRNSKMPAICANGCGQQHVSNAWRTSLCCFESAVQLINLHSQCKLATASMSLTRLKWQSCWLHHLHQCPMPCKMRPGHRRRPSNCTGPKHLTRWGRFLTTFLKEKSLKYEYELRAVNKRLRCILMHRDII